MQSNLGFIPSWQFNRDPAQNPNLTPFMQMPPGMYQTTRQPVGPYMTGMNGLGQLSADMPVQASMPSETMAPPPTMTDVLAVPDVPATFTSPDELVAFHNQFMATWWWRNRRMLGIGIAIALGLGVVGGVSAILR